MTLLSIGEFSRRSRLSAKALRRHEELGLLAPAQVDPDTGYRWYDPSQLERARLVALLRRVGLPLVQRVVDSEPAGAAALVRQFWSAVEADQAARGQLAAYVVDRLEGRRPVMEEVRVRRMPDRTVLCLEGHAAGDDEVRALGAEFLSSFRGTVPCRCSTAVRVRRSSSTTGR